MLAYIIKRLLYAIPILIGGVPKELQAGHDAQTHTLPEVPAHERCRGVETVPRLAFPLLVADDLQRPAAIEQLIILGQQVNILCRMPDIHRYIPCAAFSKPVQDPALNGNIYEACRCNTDHFPGVCSFVEIFPEVFIMDQLQGVFIRNKMIKTGWNIDDITCHEVDLQWEYCPG